MDIAVGRNVSNVSAIIDPDKGWIQPAKNPIITRKQTSVIFNGLKQMGNTHRNDTILYKTVWLAIHKILSKHGKIVKLT